MKYEIFQHAAKKIASGSERFSCISVEKAAKDAGCGGSVSDFLRKEYEDLFSSRICKLLFVSDFESEELSREEARLHRSIALLFAAEILGGE